jgi:para-aminobenzoate synthetase component I
MTVRPAVRTSHFQPIVDHYRRSATTPCDGAVECARIEWRIGESGDPATLVASFLASYGLTLPGPSAGLSITHSEHLSKSICGATLFLSAAGAAAIVGGRTGAPSPAPAVPDLAVVIHAHSVTIPLVSALPEAPLQLGEWEPSWTEDDHAAAVRSVRAAIARGDVYQVNVVGHASASYTGDPLPALHRLAALPGARYGRVLTSANWRSASSRAGDGWALSCASPETLVRVAGAVVETRPIKGTRPATAEGRRELLASIKERAEHVMIVDLERNDLARVAQTGTVTVPSLFAVRRWCHLWQAESRVTALLRDGVTLPELLRAVCPGGSVTGAPKLAALDQIAALEPVGRGPSMGLLGFLSPERLDLGLTIRTAAVDADRAHVWAGGGITWDSDPDAEVAEAAAKAAPLRAALAG